MILVMFLFIQIFIALFTLTYCVDPFCQRHQWGTYCKDDLTGYVKCSGSIWKGDDQVGFRILSSAACPTNTRCSCFAGNDCEGYVQLKNADICQAYEMVDPVREILYLRYNKNGWKDLDPHEETVYRYKEFGEIKQDLRVNSVAYRWKREGKEKFELTIPDLMGTFVKYYGDYYPKEICNKSTVNNLQIVGDGIKHFTIKKRAKLTESFETQILESHVYNGDGSGLSKGWTVFAHDKRITPVYYSHRYVGTQEEQCCGYGENIRYYRVPYDESASTNHWFKIPEFCNV